mgnify:FL=1
MAKTQKQPKRQKVDKRRVMVAVLAGFMALLILLPMFTMIMGGAGAVTQSEIDALKQEQAESQARQEELKDQLAEAEEKQSAAEEQRSLLLAQLDAINDELDNINAQIALYDEQIAQKEAERKEAEAKEQAQYELFCQRVRAMEEEGTVSYWSILFNAESFSDMLDRLADIDAVMDYDNHIMDELTATREELERLQAELESARADEQAVKEEQEAKKAEQQAKVAEAEKVLEELNRNVAEVNRLLDEEDAAAAAIQADIVRKQKELEAQRQQNGTTIVSESGYMWPLPGWYSISSPFGYRINPVSGRAQNHGGIDIPASGGTPILAAKSGQVITSVYGSGSYWSYGNYVVIDHGNGNSTLYAHMSSRAVSEGQMVTQGQVIGYVGTTGNSTGNHLHLEIRVGGQRVDPEAKFPDLNLNSW